MAVTLDSLKKAIKKNKGRSQALAWLADMERASGDYEAALKTVDAALAASSSDVPAMLVRAQILAGQQDFAGSISEYKKVLAKDPFCLSAHKKMGESYDKLGKTAERNACFRRVHDMDPLDPFWKDEYDVLTEEEQASLVAPPMDDSSFTMDVSDESENAENGEDNIFANLAASLPNTDEEDNASMDALRNSLDFASDENSKDVEQFQEADLGEHALNSSEVSSAISDILGGDDDLITEDETENKDESSSLFSHFSDDNAPVEAAAEQQSEGNEFSLDSLDEPLETDENATNIGDAFSSLLGEDELPEEISSETSSENAAEAVADVAAESNDEMPAESAEVSALDESTESQNATGSTIPTTHMDFSDEEDAGAPDLLNLDEPVETEEPKVEESETNIGDAFSSLLGDDELPEEKPAEEATADAASVDLDLDESIAETAEEAKPEEPAAEDSFGSLFEKSADADFSLNDDTPADESVAEEQVVEPQLAEGLAEKSETNVEGAFSSIFGEDELPEEKTAEEATADAASVDLDLDESIAETTEEAKPEEPAAEDSFGSLFEKSADADFSLNDDTPAEEPVAVEPVAEQQLAEEPVEESALEKAPEFIPEESAENVAPVEGLVPTSHIDFSDEEDFSKPDDDFVLDLDKETSDEKPVEEAPVAETFEAPASETPSESVEEDSAADEVDGAFDALFGDDDVVEEKPAETAAEETISEEPVAENSVAEENIVEEPVSEEPVLEDAVAEENISEEPVAESLKEESTDDDLAKEMGGAFASMFGDDDDLALPEEKKEEAVAEAPAEETLSQEATSAEIEEEVVKEDVEKNVDESFNSIFGSGDELPDEEPEETAPAEVAESAPTEVAENTVDASAETLEEAPSSIFTAPAETLEEAPSAELDSIDSEVSNAFKGLFDEDDSSPKSDEPNNKGVDYLMSGDSDDEVAASLVNDADAPLSRGATDLDDSLNTRTLADIYMEQGVYNKALEIYSDLAKKNPDNAEIKSRLEEVQKLCREKFGEV